MDSAEIEVLVGELETRVDRLRALYDQYFMGIEKLEPSVPRKDVDRRIYVLRKEQIRNTGLRFRFQMLIQRYNTYQTYWARICRQIENGTFKRHMMRAQARFGDAALDALPRKRESERPSAIPAPQLDSVEGEAPSQSLDESFGMLDDPLDAPPPSSLPPFVAAAAAPAAPKAPPPLPPRAAQPPAPATAAPAPPRTMPLGAPAAPRAVWRKAVPAAPRAGADAAQPPAAQPQPVPSAQPAAPSPPRPAAPPAPAPRVAAAAPAPRSPADLPDDRVRQLYAQYVETKRRQNESTASITYDGLARSLRESSAKLREKHGRPVDFEVTVKDGKTIIKPVVK